MKGTRGNLKTAAGNRFGVRIPGPPLDLRHFRSAHDCLLGEGPWEGPFAADSRLGIWLLRGSPRISPCAERHRAAGLRRAPRATSGTHVGPDGGGWPSSASGDRREAPARCPLHRHSPHRHGAVPVAGARDRRYQYPDNAGSCQRRPRSPQRRRRKCTLGAGRT